MFDFHEKRKIRGLLYSKISILAVLLIAVFLSFSVFERFSVEREMAAKREERERDLEELKQRAAALETQVEHLRDERGIEEELRSRFDVAKEGEQVVIILDDDTNSASFGELNAPPGAKDAEEGSFFDFFKFW